MSLKVDHLVGRPFVYGETDCYDLFRTAYIDNFGITLPNYARPTDFWKSGMNLYQDKYFQNGFKLLTCHPMDYQEGDIILMAINSSVGNHAGMLVSGSQILHHLYGRLSSLEPYRGIWKNTTLGVYRHKDVVVEKDSTTPNILEYAPSHLRAKIAEL